MQCRVSYLGNCDLLFTHNYTSKDNIVQATSYKTV